MYSNRGSYRIYQKYSQAPLIREGTLLYPYKEIAVCSKFKSRILENGIVLGLGFGTGIPTEEDQFGWENCEGS